MSQYIVLDLEMCTVYHEVFDENALNQEIIQIGAVKLNHTYDIIDTFMTYVSPQYGHIDKFINQLTGISDLELIQAPKLQDALDSFIEWVDDDIIIVTWSENDELQIRTEVEKKNIKIDHFDRYFSNFEDCQKLFNEKVGRDKNYKLSEALCVSDIDRENGEHDALIDAKNTAKLFKKLMNKEKFQFNNHYMPANDVKRSSYNPFSELLANIKFKDES